jgi:hypothetical protein
MKIQHVVSVTFEYPEFRYLGRVLDQQEVLSPIVAHLRDGIAQAVDSHQPQLGVDFPQNALLEVTTILGRRSKRQDKNHGLDPVLGFNIMDALTLAYAFLLRTGAGPITAGEVDDVVNAQTNFVPEVPNPFAEMDAFFASELWGSVVSDIEANDGQETDQPEQVEPTPAETGLDDCDCRFCKPSNQGPSDPSLN